MTDHTGVFDITTDYQQLRDSLECDEPKRRGSRWFACGVCDRCVTRPGAA